MADAKHITKGLLAAFRDDLNKAVAEIAKKHGLQGRTGGTTYTTTSFTMKVECNFPGEGREADIWRTNAKLLGLDPSLLHQTVRVADRTFTVLGLSPSGSQVLVVDQLGSRYKIGLLAFRQRAVLVPTSAQ